METLSAKQKFHKSKITAPYHYADEFFVEPLVLHEFVCPQISLLKGSGHYW